MEEIRKANTMPTAYQVSARAQYFKRYELRKKAGERLGQAAFNAFHDINPEEASKITATEYDPFYHDDRVARFIAHIRQYIPT